MTNSGDNADGVVPAGIVPPDVGPEASSGFQWQVHASQGPYTRPKYRVTTMDGGGLPPCPSSATYCRVVHSVGPTPAGVTP